MIACTLRTSRLVLQGFRSAWQEFIYATAAAFAAARTDGTVVTWGDASRGGGWLPCPT